MIFSNYQQLAARTSESSSTIQDLIHAALGIQSEGGEFADALKKHFYYNQRLDTDNLEEELGDLLWYISLAATALYIPLDRIAEGNINKLKKRYPDKFSSQAAIERVDKK